jgi:hypothetical protein
MLSTLPKVLEEIIIDYKNQMDHKEKFKPTLDEINNIRYEIFEDNKIVTSRRGLYNEGYMNDNYIEYYNLTTQDLQIEHHYNFRADEKVYAAAMHDNINGIYFEDLGTWYD